MRRTSPCGGQRGITEQDDRDDAWFFWGVHVRLPLAVPESKPSCVRLEQPRPSGP